MMLNRSSGDRPSSSGRSKRASLRSSLPLDDGQYFVYESTVPASAQYRQRPPSMHSQHLGAFPPVETDLDEPSAVHMVDAATLLTAPTEADMMMYAPAGGRPPLGTSPPMSTEEEEEIEDEAVALYDGAHLMTDDDRYGLAASEDDYMHIGGEGEAGQHRLRQVGIYGWRKKVTYLLLSVIVLLVAVNAVLTYWIISFLGFSSNGIAGLDLSREDQMVFKGNAIFERALFASEISSYQQQWLRFAQRNGDITFRSTYYDPVAEEIGTQNETTFTTTTTTEASASKRIDSKLTIGRGKVLVETDNFELYDRHRRLVFGLNTVEPAAEKQINSSTTSNGHHQMTVLIDSLNVKSLNSIRLPVALQTPAVESGSAEELKIFSPQGRLLFRGPSSVAIESKLGDASMITFDELKLQSNQGKIVLESAQGIYMRKLSTAQLSNGTSTPSSIIQRLRKPKVYQLCICQNGKLFLVAPDQKCTVQSNRDCL